MKIELTKALAHAIIDMDDHGYSEGLGPGTRESIDAWKLLLKTAEDLTGRDADETRGRKLNEKEKESPTDN